MAKRVHHERLAWMQEVEQRMEQLPRREVFIVPTLRRGNADETLQRLVGTRSNFQSKPARNVVPFETLQVRPSRFLKPGRSAYRPVCQVRGCPNDDTPQILVYSNLSIFTVVRELHSFMVKNP